MASHTHSDTHGHMQWALPRKNAIGKRAQNWAVEVSSHVGVSPTGSHVWCPLSQPPSSPRLPLCSQVSLWQRDSPVCRSQHVGEASGEKQGPSVARVCCEPASCGSTAGLCSNIQGQLCHFAAAGRAQTGIDSCPGASPWPILSCWEH